jgi:hypothetical protein
MCLRDIGFKNLKIISDLLKNESKNLFLSLCEEIFWFVFSKLEAKHECTQTSFHKRFKEITINLLNMNEFYLFKNYFEEKFYVIENWFDSNEEYFDYMIKLFLLSIHFNSNSCKETETKIFGNIFKTILLTMNSSANNQKLDLIAIRILYSILKELSDSELRMVSFDRYKCIQLVMNSLIIFNDTDMNGIAVWISYILIKELSFVEKSNLFSNNSYVKTLLDIVESHAQQSSIPDVILNYTLDYFWSLIDGSPKICEIFVEKKGLDLFFLLLKVWFVRIIYIFKIEKLSYSQE